MADIKLGFEYLEAWPEMPVKIFNNILDQAEQEAETSVDLLRIAARVCNSSPTPFTRTALRNILAERWGVNPNALPA